MKGQVYTAHSNKYYVKCGLDLIKCDARGVLKIKSEGISVGDYVNVEGGVITQIFERKNSFIRPKVSNVDKVIAVFSPEPKPDFYLLDKLYLNCVKENVEFIIVVNKTDLEKDLFDRVKDEYGVLGVKVLNVCAQNGDGLENLKNILSNNLSVLAGQSAAGKTSLINAMFNLDLKTGDLSEKISRGKHTTTRSQIYEFGDIKIIDSPGFAVIDADVSIKDLPNCYPEYLQLAGGCKFRGCSHVSEPDCMVKQAVEMGKLSKNRYERYLEIYEEISKRRTIYEKN